jgi:hypothetical protein
MIIQFNYFISIRDICWLNYIDIGFKQLLPYYLMEPKKFSGHFLFSFQFSVVQKYGKYTSITFILFIKYYSFRILFVSFI